MILSALILLLVFLTATAEGSGSCDGTYTLSYGSLHSVNFPLPYANNTDCQYFIRPVLNKDRVIKVTPVVFDLEEGYDVLEVREGGPHGRYIGRFTGSVMPILYGKSFWMRFTSDYTKSRRGFKFAWSAVTEGVRLVNGSGSLDGRVEVFHGGQWGTVCDDTWDAKGAYVICKMMGFTDNTAEYFGSAHYGPGSELPILLDDTECSTDMLTISECRRKAWGEHNCQHSEDSGVRCTEAADRTKEMLKRTEDADCSKRLTSSRGQLTSPDYPLYPNSYSCEYVIGEPSIPLTQLTFSVFDLEEGSDFLEIREAGPNGPFIGRFTGSRLPPVLYAKRLWLTFKSDESVEGAGFKAQWQSAANSGYRLRNGTRYNEGRVEVFDLRSGEWGTVCDDHWGTADANVVCRGLGYTADIRDATALQGAAFGRGQGDILFDDVDCTGSEESLLDCRADDENNCGHHEDAAVRCNSKTKLSSSFLRNASIFLDDFLRKESWNLLWSTADTIRTNLDSSISTATRLLEADYGCESDTNTNACILLGRLRLFRRLVTDLQAIGNDTLFDYYRALIPFHPDLLYVETINLNFKSLPDSSRMGDAEYRHSFLSQSEFMRIIINRTVLRTEADRVCGKEDAGDKCFLRDVFVLYDKVELFLAQLRTEGQWQNENIMNYFHALTLHSALLKMNYPSRVKVTPVFQPEGAYIINPADSRPKAGTPLHVVTRLLKAVSKYIDQNDDKKLGILLSLLPATVSQCLDKQMCLLSKVFDQARMYLKSQQPRVSHVQVRILNTDLDLKELLEQKQMERILKMLTHQDYNLRAVAENLKSEFSKQLYNRFSDLKTYFKKIHAFSASIAQSDLGVIDELNELQKTATSLAHRVGDGVQDILLSTMVSVGLELMENKANFAVVMAESLNPLKWVTDSALSEVRGAAAELSNALASVAKASRLLTAISVLQDKSVNIRVGFAENREFVLNMKTIIDSLHNGMRIEDFEAARNSFLDSYRDYEPAITNSDLVEMAGYFTNVVDEACSLIEGSGTALATVTKGIVGGSGLCWETRILIDKMITVYEAIYEKQFETIQVLVDILQAKVALEAADGIVAEYDDLAKGSGDTEDALLRLQVVSGMSYMSYKIMVNQVITMYCDELEYKSGGQRPHICKGTRTDISTLLSYREPRCSMRKLKFQTIPDRRATQNDSAYIDIRQLYSGEEISFKIPNSTWLLEHGWITKADINSVIYVSGFEVYLPSEIDTQRDIRVGVSAEGENELVPGGLRYKILPSRPMLFEYTVDSGCRQHRGGYDNPYSTCPTNKVPEVCPVTELPCFLKNGKRALNPSIFAHFKIRINGYEGFPIPNPATPLPVRVAIRKCIYVPDGREADSEDFKIQGKRRRRSTCCSEGQFWSSVDMSCQTCPSNSTVALRGYYCEKQKSQP